MKELLDKVKLDLGRILGQAKRKEKDVVELWMNMVAANGIKPTDRLLELLAWDLQQGGIDLKEFRQKSKFEEIQDAFDQASLAKEISALAANFARQSIERELQHSMEIQQLIQERNRLLTQQQQQEEPILKQFQSTKVFDPTIDRRFKKE